MKIKLRVNKTINQNTRYSGVQQHYLHWTYCWWILEDLLGINSGSIVSQEVK